MLNVLYDAWEEYVLIPTQKKRVEKLLTEYKVLFREPEVVDDLLNRAFVKGMKKGIEKSGKSEEEGKEIIKKYFNQRGMNGWC